MLHAMRRLLAVLRRDRLDDELAEEMRLHLDLRRRAAERTRLPADCSTHACRCATRRTEIAIRLALGA